MKVILATTTLVILASIFGCGGTTANSSITPNYDGTWFGTAFLVPKTKGGSNESITFSPVIVRNGLITGTCQYENYDTSKKLENGVVNGTFATAGQFLASCRFSDPDGTTFYVDIENVQRSSDGSKFSLVGDGTGAVYTNTSQSPALYSTVHLSLTN